MPRMVHDRLVTARILTLEDTEKIGAAKTTRGSNLIMYQSVLSKVRSRRERMAVKEAICGGLCESSQYCPFKEDQQPASTFQHEQILNIRDRLINDMEVDPVLDRLVQAGIADFHEQELVRAGKTRRDRVVELLDFMHHKHSQAHDTFMEILRETNLWIFEDELTT